MSSSNSPDRVAAQDRERGAIREPVASSNRAPGSPAATTPCPKCAGAPSDVQAECRTCGGYGHIPSAANEYGLVDGSPQEFCDDEQPHEPHEYIVGMRRFQCPGLPFGGPTTTELRPAFERLRRALG